MNLVHRSESFAVFDDFLSQADFRDTFATLQEQEYESPHVPAWSKVWRLEDGQPYRGVKVDYYHDPENWTFRPFMKALAECSATEGDLLGPWKDFQIAPFLYTQGTRLSWHTDGEYTGAAVYLAHPRWSPRWGGDFMVAEAPKDWVRRIPKRMGEVDGMFTDEILSEIGLSHGVLPKPNRLILLKGGTWHMINRVDAAAGDQPRCSLSGFFGEEVFKRPRLSLRGSAALLRRLGRKK